MGVLTASIHEYWATISGESLEEILKQQAAVWNWGVSAVEFRADLIPPQVYDELLALNEWQGPTFIAHFGTGEEAEIAYDATVKAINTNILGVICHSHCELAREIQHACIETRKLFAVAYHSQQPMTLSEALHEFERQEAFQPLFRKIAVRAHQFEEALAIVEATHRASMSGGIPVVGAVFGPHRWARVVMPHAGSAISFILAHQVRNEEGEDDEQLQITEVDYLQRIRGLYPAKSGQIEHTVESPLSERSGGV